MNTMETLRDGATYAGHTFHIILNYSVLLLVLLPHFFPGRQQARGWLILFLLFTVLQAALWFATGAVGISLIWCAMAGYNLLLFFLTRKEGTAIAFLFLFSPLVSIGAMIFYYLYFPVITTLAHGTAFLFGFALGFRLQRRQKRNSTAFIPKPFTKGWRL